MSYNHRPSEYNTNLYLDPARSSIVSGLTKESSDAVSFQNTFGSILHPIVFQPSLPDSTELNLMFDRTALSPTGISSICNVTLRLMVEGSRIKTTEKAVTITQPMFAYGSSFGFSKLIVSVNGQALPRNTSDYSFPISNEDGIHIDIRPGPEFQHLILSESFNLEPPPVFDTDIIFLNLFNGQSIQQTLSYSVGY